MLVPSPGHFEREYPEKRRQNGRLLVLLVISVADQVAAVQGQQAFLIRRGIGHYCETKLVKSFPYVPSIEFEVDLR